ncbi:GntR family transcriptional regulator [Alicyclobacillus sacchari]|nr:GntR family transcriptional regulator [Alicyclobacillus sacchari]
MNAGSPLQDEIVHWLRDRILGHEFTPGDQLPTEKQLSEQLHVSRITVHRALKRLADEGLIHRYPGKGTFVAQLPSTFKEEIIRDDIQSSNTGSIAYILPGISAAFGTQLLKSVMSTLEEAGFNVVVSFTNNSQEAERAAIQRVLRLGVKGILVSPVNGEYYNDIILRLHLDHFPIVLVDKRLDKIPVPFVTTNNRAAAYELTKHLLSLGHKNIGFLSPPDEVTTSLQDRFAGFLAALASEHVSFDPDLRLCNLPTGGAIDKPDGKAVYENMEQFVLEHPSMTAVIATEHVFATMLEDICTKHAIRVPKELSIACFDSPASWIERPRFTHIVQQEEQIGRIAAELLLQFIQCGPRDVPVAVELPGQLSLGRSSGPPSMRPHTNA